MNETASKPVSQKNEWFATIVHKFIWKCVKTHCVGGSLRSSRATGVQPVHSIHSQPVTTNYKQNSTSRNASTFSCRSPTATGRLQSKTHELLCQVVQGRNGCSNFHEHQHLHTSCKSRAPLNNLQGHSRTSSATEICPASIPSSCCCSTHCQGR